jgi:hypothetical protein
MTQYNCSTQSSVVSSFGKLLCTRCTFMCVWLNIAWRVSKSSTASMPLIRAWSSSLRTPDALVRQEAAEVRLDLRVDARAAQKVLDQNRHLHECATAITRPSEGKPQSNQCWRHICMLRSQQCMYKL